MDTLRRNLTKPRIVIILIIIAVISLPIIVSQVLRQQDIRQGATGTPASVSYNFSPATTPPNTPLQVGQTIDVALMMNAGSNDVGSMQVKVNYPPTLLQYIDITEQPTGLKAIKKGDANGKLHIVAINQTIQPVTGNAIKIMTIRFKALAAGEARITVDSPLDTTASTFRAFAPVDNIPGIVGTYTIAGDCTALTTGRPTACYCTNNTQCESNSCIPKPENVTPMVGSIVSNNICAPIPTATPTPNCTDTDGGLNYNVKGTITSKYSNGTPYTDSDSCYNGSNTLIEFTCQLNGQGNNNVSFYCPNGCSDGACLPPAVPTGKYCSSNADCPSGYYCPAIPADSTNYPSPIFVCEPALSSPTPTQTPTPTATPLPTLTSVPTATTVPGDTSIRLSVKLPGIGLGAANLGLNPTPIHPQRLGLIQVLNQDGQSVLTNEAYMIYTDGVYVGVFPLGQTFNSGTYRFKIRLGNTLYEAYPTVFNLTRGLTYDPVIPAVSLISGDLNGDNALTIQDYNNYLACFKGLSSCSEQMKTASDFNDDGIVEGDLIDNNIIQYGFANQSGD